MGYMNFPPLEPQEGNGENKDNSKSKILTKNTEKMLGKTLMEENRGSSEIKDIEPMPLLTED